MNDTRMCRLTRDQKRYIINYYLSGAGKGLFEDCDVFATEDVEDNYDQYKQEADDFIEAIRNHIMEYCEL